MGKHNYIPKRKAKKTECVDCLFIIYFAFGRHPPLQGGPSMSWGHGRVGRSGPWYWWLHLNSFPAFVLVGSVVGGFSTRFLVPFLCAIPFKVMWNARSMTCLANYTLNVKLLFLLLSFFLDGGWFSFKMFANIMWSKGQYCVMNWEVY